MSSDPILRFLGCDFPTLSTSFHHQLDWCSWIGQIAVPAGAGLYTLRQNDGNGFISLARILVVNQIFLEVMKRLIASTRPNGHAGSFPSGHTAAAFLGAAFLVFRYDFDALPFTLAGLAAAGVGLSRVVLRAHWVHDVVAGAFMGVALVFVAKKTHFF
jgi:membrane-associated phospholipid phosphatase